MLQLLNCLRGNEQEFFCMTKQPEKQGRQRLHFLVFSHFYYH